LGLQAGAEFRLLAGAPTELARVTLMNSPASSVRPAVINHVVKGLLHLTVAAFLGFAAIQFGFLDERMQDQGVQFGFAAGFGAVALGFALAGCRNIHALFRPPFLQLSPEGVKLRCWHGTGFTGFFLPYYRMRDYTISWADFGQTETFTHRVNGVPIVQELRIKTKQGLVAFGWDVFSPNVARIQRSILDYIDEVFRGTKRAEARLADLQRLRWQQPLQFRFTIIPFWLVPLALVGAVAAVATGQALEVKGDWPPVIAIMCLLGAFIAGGKWWRARRSCTVEFRSDGLALGPSVNSLRVIPWTDIQFVRPQTFTSTYGWGSAGGTPALVGLELRKINGSYFTIEGLKPAELQRLHVLLEPPLDAVIAAQASIARGTAPEAAAVAAGIAAR
jgi:hypothetical protein